MDIAALVIAILAALAAAASAWYARGQVQQARNQVAEMRTQSQEMRNQVDQMQAQSQLMRDQVDQARNQSQEMRNQVGQMQAQSQLMRDQVDQARGQNQEMRNQVEEMRREFELSGPYLEVSIRYAGMAAGAPLIVDLSNKGREEARITDLIIRPYRQGLMVPGGFVQLPNNLLPRPPLNVPPDGTVTWSFSWRWVTQQAQRLGFDGIKFEVVRGNHKRLFSEPVATSFVPFRLSQPSTSQRSAEERERRREELMGPAMKVARDTEVNPADGSQADVHLETEERE
jgi:hypothetical protein